MKKSVVTLLMGILSILSFAQERVFPTYGVDIERGVSLVEIEGKKCYDVTIEIKAAELASLFVNGVKIIVKDSNNKRLYKKRFIDSRLYAYPDGSIIIGKGDALTNMLLWKDKKTGNWFAIIREKGIY